MRKVSNASSPVPTLFHQDKQVSHSLSTQQSPRQHLHKAPSYKQKSQLCKKFVQNGYCPYQKRCKFAHGLHELKKNCQTNCKYKTKVCGGFLQEGFCAYGNRCNFIHPNSCTSGIKNRAIDSELLDIKQCVNKQSRLLKILQE